MPDQTKTRRGCLRKLLLLAGVLILCVVLALAWLFRPLPTADLTASPAPAHGYDEAMERIEAIHADEAALPLHNGGRTIVLSHGHPTDRVFVLLHGFTNSPRQFRELGELLFARGANVVIPRLPYHGLTDRLTNAHGDLTAANLIRYAESGIDIARGLGKRITLVGLSVSGISAGWLAHQRDDLDEVFLFAPFFGPAAVPDALTPAVTAALVRWPNTFLWWDPRARENILGPPLNYPRFATRPLGEAMRLGLDAEQQTGPLRVKRFGLVLTASDKAVNNRRTLRIVSLWEYNSPGTEFFIYTFPLEDRIPHDFIDPLQNGAQTGKVYPRLVSWLMDSSLADQNP